MNLISNSEAKIDGINAKLRVELDSHANMVIMGKNSFIFESSRKTYDVKPFMTGLGTAKNVSIVDTAVAYDCPYERKTYILIFRNALYFQEMKNCLVPPFILREGGSVDQSLD